MPVFPPVRKTPEGQIPSAFRFQTQKSPIPVSLKGQTPSVHPGLPPALPPGENEDGSSGMNVVTVISILASLLGAGIVVAIRKLRPAESCTGSPADWLDEFSIERYRPMLRLVDDAQDAHWASLQASLTANQAEQYRRQRCRILDGYLQEMTHDFERMTKAVERLTGPGSPQAAAGLGRCQRAFFRELRAAHWQVARYARGEGSIDLESLLAAFDTMQRELRRLLVQPAPLAA